jgi:hypothetical protein
LFCQLLAKLAPELAGAEGDRLAAVAYAECIAGDEPRALNAYVH